MKKYSIAVITVLFLALLLSFSAFIFADDNTGSPIIGGPIHLYNNIGGLNTKSSVTSIAENEATDLQNVYFDLHGAIKKRSGYSLFNNSAVAATSELVTGLLQFTNSAGTTFNIASAGKNIKYISGGNWVAATGSLTAGNIFDIDIGNDYAIFTNNVNRVQKWNGSGNTSDIIPFTGFEKARCLAYHQGYLFLANVEVSSVRYPSRIYYSTQGDITSWSAADYLDININDGQDIIGLAVDGYGNLLILKNDSTWKLSASGGFSPATWRLSKVSSDIGCVSTYSIVNIENELVWLARKGVYGWTGGSLEYLSDKIQPEIDNLNQNRLSYAVGGHLAKLNQYWLSVSDNGSSTNNIIFIYDYSLGAWTKYTGINASYLATWLINNAPTLISGNYSGYVFNQNTGNTDNNAAIDAYYDTKWFNFGDPIGRKNISRLTTIVNSEGNFNINGTSYINFKGDGVVASNPSTTTFPISLYSGGYLYDDGHYYDTGLQYTTQTQLINERNIDVDAYWFKLRFRNQNANEPFTIHGYSIEGRILGQ